LFPALLYTHILLAIVAVGSNMTYAVWTARAARHPEHLAFALRGVKLIDDRIANPAYGLLLVTGLLMVWRVPVPLAQFWLVTALILYGLAVALAAGVYTPTLRRQIEALEQHGADSGEYRRRDARATAVGIALAVLVIAIVFFMVVRPTV